MNKPNHIKYGPGPKWTCTKICIYGPDFKWYCSNLH